MTPSDPLDGKIREAVADLVARAPLAPEFEDLAPHRRPRRPVGMLVVASLAAVVAAIGGVALSGGGDADVSTGITDGGPDDPAALREDTVNSTTPTSTPAREEHGATATSPSAVLVLNGSSRCGVAGRFAEVLRQQPFAGQDDLDVLAPANAWTQFDRSTVYARPALLASAEHIASLLEPAAPVEELGSARVDWERSIQPDWEGPDPAIVVVLGDDQAAAWAGCEATTHYGPPAAKPG